MIAFRKVDSVSSVSSVANVFCHSSLSATFGLSPAARRAGIQAANAAISANNTAIAAKVAGSVALTPTSKLAITRVSAIAAITPSASKTAQSWTVVGGAARRRVSAVRF
jgi:hypothetical protein